MKTEYPKLDDLLSYTLYDDKMVYDEVLSMITMRKNIQQVKKKHPYEIHYTEKSGWFTEVDDATRPTGKRKVRRCSEESLWEALSDWYLDNNRNATLVDIYSKWLTGKQTPTNADNIKRIQASWNAYYLKEPLSTKILSTPLSRITSLMLREWAEALLKKHYPVDKKKFSRIFSIVNQCFEYASDEEQVFTDEERRLLKIMVEEDLILYQKQPTCAGLQILFLFETGLRIGECCGLKWTDIRNNRLYIRRQANNDGVKEWTKSTAGYRDIPLTKEAQRLLELVKDYNQKQCLTAEWIFQSNNPNYDYRISYNAADRKLRKLCKRLGTVVKSPHKCRKTCISALLDCPDINNRTVQRFARHQDLSTTFGYYSFERKTKEEQAFAIDKALAI